MLTTCLLLPFAFDRPSRYAGAGQHVELPQEAKGQVQCAAHPLQTSSFSPAGPVGLDQDHHQLILYAITDTTTPNSSSTSQNIRLSFATHCQPASHTHSTEAQHATAYRRQTTHSSTPDSTLQLVLSCTLCALKRQLTHSLCACTTAADAPQPLLVLAGSCLQQPSYRTVGLKVCLHHVYTNYRHASAPTPTPVHNTHTLPSLLSAQHTSNCHGFQPQRPARV